MTERIIKQNGGVYLVIEHDVYGRNKTMHYLGKDPDLLESEKTNEKPKDKKKKGEE